MAKQLAEKKAERKGSASKLVRGLISICAAGGQGVAAIVEA
jgi:acetyl-CoA C-acetyltransferase